MIRAASLIILLSACQGASSNPGLDALLRVSGAQFVPGAMPAEGAGPDVLALQLLSSKVQPGELSQSLQGSVSDGATAVAIGLAHDIGHFIIGPGSPDPITRVLAFRTSFSLSPMLPLGAHELLVSAVDASKRYGTPASRTLEAEEPLIEGTLVVSLAWSSEADLDLHVIDARGVEIWARNISSYENPRPGSQPDPAEVAMAGVLDFDSNSGCVLDGRRRENVIWKMAPPSGTYVVRVDTSSLCGQANAPWTVEAHLSGTVVGQSRGVALPTDADRWPHQRGSGVTALVFDVP